MSQDSPLYDKYVVARTDGTDGAGGKHEGCRYLVLDMTHDKAAKVAAHAFAEACEADRPLLAASIRETWPAGPLERKPSRWRPFALPGDVEEDPSS